ncbi:serpin B6 [Nephila pilipes]|uniref:Serpin B6 n=1 Tax=Nephila pilipes TaxID=299642 RepID=A0A8X6R3H6_NEPPI|nr:serpin B6 [Nephila pilipes]
MLIVLPNKRCQLKSTEKSVTPKKLLTYYRGLHEKTVDIFFPKFKFEKEFSSVSKHFGAIKAFDRDVDDFSQSSFRNNTDVGRLVNKIDSVIEGKRSEVSGTTEIIDGNEAPQEIIVNHPFLFLIVEKGSGSDWIIFLGSINNL